MKTENNCFVLLLLLFQQQVIGFQQTKLTRYFKGQTVLSTLRPKKDDRFFLSNCGVKKKTLLENDLKIKKMWRKCAKGQIILTKKSKRKKKCSGKKKETEKKCGEKKQTEKKCGEKETTEKKCGEKE